MQVNVEKIVFLASLAFIRGFFTNFRRSDANVRGAYTFLMESIGEEHSEIRLSAFQLVNELFQRSHFFRQLLTVDFQRLVTLGNLVV